MSNPDLAIDIDAYISNDDGHWVIHVDTPGVKDNEHGPVCRIYLNDDLGAPIWHNTDGEDSGKD